MNKKKFDYFAAYEKQAEFAQEIVQNLRSGLSKGELGEKSLFDALHVMENDADSVNHSIQERLAQDFTVPFDRGDMNELANALDDICDSVEEIAIRSYIWSVNQLPGKGSEMIECLAKGVSNIVQAVSMLKNMRSKFSDIRKFCFAAQEAESRCDALYIESARGINEGSASFEERSVYIEILGVAEDAMDTIENAAEVIERVLASNI